MSSTASKALFGATLAGLAIVAGVLIWLASDTDPRSPEPGMPEPAHRPEAGTEVGERVAAAREQPSETGFTATVPSAGEVLEDYWGDDWEEVRERLVAKDHDLDFPLQLAPWETVAPLVEERMRYSEAMAESQRSSRLEWPDPLTTDWVEERFGQRYEIDEIDLAEIEAIAFDYNRQAKDRIEEYIEGVDLALRHAWKLGRAEVCPYTTDALPDRPLRAFYSMSSGQAGWAIRLELYPEDHPHLMQLEREIQHLRRKRDNAVWSWLKSR